MDIFEIPLNEIVFDDATRQRKQLKKIDELADNIRRVGQLQPIILDSRNNLIAGRRRLEAMKRLGRERVLATYVDTLAPLDQKLVELSENLQREDLTWQERATAVLEIHNFRGGGKGDGELKATAEFLGYDQASVTRYVRVGQALLDGGDETLNNCSSINQANELVNRRRQLKVDTAMSQITEDDGLALIEPSGAVVEPTASPPEKMASVRYEIVQGDFIELARTYSGPKFNLVHCDFPYGIGIDKSDAAGSDAHESQYADDPEIFWALTDALLRNRGRLFLDSAHLMFWYSKKHEAELVERLAAAGFWMHHHPLIWHKSDGMGIASDFRRRPKHVYETALWCSLGDRPLIQLKNDLFAAPSARSEEGHLSAKPEEMLKYFLSMAASGITAFLDPTCGSGTSVRAAASLGVERALGIEVNPQTALGARLKLEKALRNTAPG